MKKIVRKDNAPKIWYDESFSLFKNSDGAYNLREVVEHLEKLTPYLAEISNIEDHVTSYINAGVVNGLQNYLESVIIGLDFYGKGVGKVVISVFDGDDTGLGEKSIDLQSDVDALASGREVDPKAMEAWAVWFEDAAKKIRAGIPKGKGHE